MNETVLFLLVGQTKGREDTLLSPMQCLHRMFGSVAASAGICVGSSSLSPSGNASTRVGRPPLDAEHSGALFKFGSRRGCTVARHRAAELLLYSQLKNSPAQGEVSSRSRDLERRVSFVYSTCSPKPPVSKRSCLRPPSPAPPKNSRPFALKSASFALKSCATLLSERSKPDVCRSTTCTRL